MISPTKKVTIPKFPILVVETLVTPETGDGKYRRTTGLDGALPHQAVAVVGKPRSLLEAKSEPSSCLALQVCELASETSNMLLELLAVWTAPR